MSLLSIPWLIHGEMDFLIGSFCLRKTPAMKNLSKTRKVHMTSFGVHRATLSIIQSVIMEELCFWRQRPRWKKKIASYDVRQIARNNNLAVNPIDIFNPLCDGGKKENLRRCFNNNVFDLTKTLVNLKRHSFYKDSSHGVDVSLLPRHFTFSSLVIGTVDGCNQFRRRWWNHLIVNSRLNICDDNARELWVNWGKKASWHSRFAMPIHADEICVKLFSVFSFSRPIMTRKVYFYSLKFPFFSCCLFRDSWFSENSRTWLHGHTSPHPRMESKRRN